MKLKKAISSMRNKRNKSFEPFEQLSPICEKSLKMILLQSVSSSNCLQKKLMKVNENEKNMMNKELQNKKKETHPILDQSIELTG
jgi:hypothetical protein